MKNKNIQKKYVIIVVVILIASLAVVCLRHFSKYPPVSLYLHEFGVSTRNIKVETIDFCADHAFRDPGAAYIVKINGNTENTVFDPSAMQNIITEKTLNFIKSINDYAKSNDFRFRIDIADDSELISSELNSKNNNTLHIIYDQKKDLYYLLWMTW